MEDDGDGSVRKNECGGVEKVKGQSARRAVLSRAGPSLSKQLFKLSNGDLKKGDVVKQNKKMPLSRSSPPPVKLVFTS